MEQVENTSDLHYQDLFIVGICAIGASAVFATISMLTFIGMSTIGVCLMAIGLANRSKWKT